MENDLIASPVPALACPKCGHSMDVQGRPAFSAVACEKCQTMLTVPVMLGAFLLVERLGSGGMGAVYRALDTSLNRFVAVKVMKAALGEDAGLVKSFISEARAAAALNHKNIVQIYSCGQESGQPYIVMELVTGGRLSNMFSREKPINEIPLLKMAMDVAEGLQAANQAGLVHGDIKPENVLIDKHGTAKIVDFGLAQFVNAQKDRGEIWGTPYYISPERARGNKADHRSDIYSLGATLFHALAGEPPFEGETPVDVVLARLKHPPPGLASLRPDLQPQTVELVERMMAADPQLRYPNPASLKADINAALQAAKAAGKPDRDGRPKVRPAQLIVAAIAAAALAVLAYALVGGMQKKDLPAEASASVKAKKPVVPAPPVELPLFTDAELKRLSDVVGAAKLEEPVKLHKELVSFRDEFKRTSKSDGYLWVRLYESVPLWLLGRSGEAHSIFTNAMFNVTEGEVASARTPKLVAAYLAGNATKDGIDSSGVPAELVGFLEAGKLLSESKWTAASEKIFLYINTTSRAPAWAFALVPLAAELHRAVSAHIVTAGGLDQMIANRQYEPALEAFSNYEKEAPPFFAGALAPYAQKIRDLEAQLAAEEQARKEQAYRARVDEDLKRLDGMLADIIPGMLRSNNFNVASVLITSRTAGLETDEGRAAAQLAREKVDALEGMKKFLYAATDIAPFPKAQGFRFRGGDLMKASLQGLRTSVGGRPQPVINWHEVPPEVVVQIVDYYSRNESLAVAERAGALMGVTVFLAMHQQTNAAISFATRALEMNPELKPKIQRLTPGLLPQE